MAVPRLRLRDCGDLRGGGSLHRLADGRARHLNEELQLPQTADTIWLLSASPPTCPLSGERRGRQSLRVQLKTWTARLTDLQLDGIEGAPYRVHVDTHDHTSHDGVFDLQSHVSYKRRCSKGLAVI